MSTKTNSSSKDSSLQFEGSTIEAALEAAVSELGEDLEVLDAQRISTRRLLRLGKRERFEVTALRRGSEPKGFDDVLRRMVERVDDAERSVGADLADSDRGWWSEAEFVLPQERAGASMADARDAVRPAADLELDVRLEPARATAAHPSLADQARRMAESSVGAGHSVFAAPVVPEDPEPISVDVSRDDTASHRDNANSPSPTGGDATRAVEAPDWSCAALLALDLPPALVGRIDGEQLHEDLEWVSALAKAIGDLLDVAGHVSGPCELTGHGAESAIHLLRGACDGFRLDSLIIDGRRVPATPLELALAVRSLIPSASPARPCSAGAQ